MATEDRAAWGPLIAERRAQLGWSQARLAELADLSEKSIFSLEKGSGSARLSTLRKVQEALRLPTDFDAAETMVAAINRYPARAATLESVGEWLRNAVAHGMSQEDIHSGVQRIVEEDGVRKADRRLRDERALVALLEDHFDRLPEDRRRLLDMLAHGLHPETLEEVLEWLESRQVGGGQRIRVDWFYERSADLVGLGGVGTAEEGELATAARNEDREKRSLSDD